MSEYQCYQFDAIGRTLTSAQRKAVSQLSSHISVGGSSAVVEYHYSDFKHDPIKVLERYFDLFTYEANWGVQRIAFRFDRAAFDSDALSAYAIDQAIEVIEKNDYVIIDCYLDENWDAQPDYNYNGGYYHEDDFPSGSPFTSFYQEVLEGDFRSLYLFWLKAAELYDPDASSPVPDGLTQLEDDHWALTRFIGLDDDSLAAAQSLSKTKRKRIRAFEPERHLALLSVDESRKHLRNLLLKNPSSAKAQLISDLRAKAKIPSTAKKNAASATPFADLMVVARASKEARRKKAEEERLQKEKAYFEKLKKNQARMWAKVPEFIERRKTKYYEYAVLVLNALKQLAAQEGKLEGYYERAHAIASRYPTLSGLQWRLEAAQVTDRGTLSEKLYYQNQKQRWAEENSPEKEFPFHLLNE